MNHDSNKFVLSAIALAASALLAACGGGEANPPPDTTPPTLAITDNVEAATANGPVTFAFTFSEDVGTSFTAEDITVTGGTAGPLTKVNATNYTLVVTPAANSSGTIVVTVDAAKFSDLANNVNTSSTTAQQAYSTLTGAQMSLPVSFDDAGVAYGLIGFGGAEDSTIVDDPTSAGNKVARVVRAAGAETFAGTTITGPEQLGFSPAIALNANNTRMTVRVWSPDAGTPVRLKIEDHTDPGKSVETQVSTTVASNWETLTFDFSNQATGTAALNLGFSYTKATIFFDFGRAQGEAVEKTYYFDDVQLASGEAPPPPPPPVGGGTVIANFDDVSPPVAGFEGGDGSVVEPGPAGGGSGNSFKVLRSGGQPFALGIIETTVPVTADRRTLQAQVFSPTAGIPMVLKLEGPAGANTGDTPANETVVQGWQTLTWTFNINPDATYNKVVLLPNLGTVDAPPGQSYYFDDLLLLGDEPVAPPANEFTTLANFDDVNPPVAGFEGGDGSAVEPGPAGGGSGNSFKVLRSGGQVFALGIIETTVPVSANRRTVRAQVFSPTAGIPMVLKLEGPAGANTGDTPANETVVEGWQTLTWTFNINPAATYNKIVLLPNLGTVDAPPGKAYYFDDIQLLGAPEGGGGGEEPGAFTGVFANDYVGDLFVNAKSVQGGDVGVFFDPRLPAAAAAPGYEYAGVAGTAQDPGGVPNFYQGFGLRGAPITDAYYGAFVKSPGNGTVDVSGYTNLKLRVWGPDQLFQASTFPLLRVVLQTPPVAGCNSSSGGSEVTASFQTITQGAASEYTLPLSGFTVQVACSGETVAQILANVAQLNILLEGTEIQYQNNQPGDAFGNGLNVGPIRFE